MVYYRYLPTTRKEAVMVGGEAVTPPFDTDDIPIDTGSL
jgi:hypothetical protein